MLVHGGGPEINSWLARLGIKSKFVNGLRYTDSQTLEIVEMALSGKLNKYFVGELYQRGVQACGISGRDGGLAPSKRISPLGFVGEPKKINSKLIRLLLKNGYVPVVSSIGITSSGSALNLNADTLATAIATELGARRLSLLTDVCGVLDAARKTIPCIRVSEAKKLFTGGVVTGGMIPKLKACVLSVKKGIREVWIADGVNGLKDLKGTVIKR